MPWTDLKVSGDEAFFTYLSREDYVRNVPFWRSSPPRVGMRRTMCTLLYHRYIAHLIAWYWGKQWTWQRAEANHGGHSIVPIAAKWLASETYNMMMMMMMIVMMMIMMMMMMVMMMMIVIRGVVQHIVVRGDQSSTGIWNRCVFGGIWSELHIILGALKFRPLRSCPYPSINISTRSPRACVYMGRCRRLSKEITLPQ